VTRLRAFVRRARRHGWLKALLWGDALDRGDQDQDGMLSS